MSARVTHARGRLEGKRRRVRHWLIVPVAKGVGLLRLILDCGHVAHRRDVGAHPIWAICEKCPIEEKLSD